MVRENITTEELKANNAKYIGLMKEVLTPQEYEKWVVWAKGSDLFVAPASTKYHSVYVGGLVDHMLGVYEFIYKTNTMLGNIYSKRSITLASLMHDYCKVGVYKTEIRRRKVDGQWTDVEEYVFHDDYPFGHGEKSVDIINEIGIVLTRDEKDLS